jgi:K+-sensing histidine kinase KdpD
VNLGLDAYRRLTDGEIDVFRTEKRYVRKDGRIIWASITVTSNRDKEGRHLYNQAIVEDITERKSTEENVRLLNNRLRLLIEAIQELSMSTSLECIMKTVSTTVRSLLNADGATFILRDGDQSWYVDEDAIAPLWKGQRFPMTECVSGWSMMNRQVAVVPDIYTDGRVPVKIYESTFVRSMALAPIRISDPLGVVGAYWKDLYSPAPAEVQLLQTLADAAAKAVENMQLIDGLEKKINERTAELQTVNDELEAFSYSVSHDLRAPLRHIHGFSEILLNNYSEELPEEAARYLGTIIGAAKQMGVLIDDLLSLSRTGRAELRKTIVSMETVVNEALSTLSQQLKGREIEWQADSLPSCYCDARLIRQVWINLIDNAVKYTRRKKKAVIKIGHRTENGESVYFITDNGVGFDMQYAGKLFGVFQRMHSSNDFEGTGVGLANVHRIITRHGGKIWAEAKPDRGATFFFKLPMQ